MFTPPPSFSPANAAPSGGDAPRPSALAPLLATFQGMFSPPPSGGASSSLGISAGASGVPSVASRNVSGEFTGGGYGVCLTLLTSEDQGRLCCGVIGAPSTSQRFCMANIEEKGRCSIASHHKKPVLLLLEHLYFGAPSSA